MRRINCVVAVMLAAVLVYGSSAWAGGKESDLAKKPASAPRNRLVIHEWGTFTSLQDEVGRTITGVNTDDEPVPEFVHRISELIPRPTELAPVYYKGVPRSHRQVRMRLETPVLYFYPPTGQREPLHASVQVGFRGGWLTEYYPKADVSAPGLQEGDFRFAGLSPKTVGTLAWHDLTSGRDSPGPETQAQVGLAPRQVRAATVRGPGGEAEKYLFYRGVGNLPSPLNVSRTAENDALVIREDVNPELGLRAPLSIRAMWLVHVREDGSVAFRTLGGVELMGESGRELARTPIDLVAAAVPAGKNTGAGDTKPELETLIERYSPTNLA